MEDTRRKHASRAVHLCYRCLSRLVLFRLVLLSHRSFEALERLQLHSHAASLSTPITSGESLTASRSDRSEGKPAKAKGIGVVWCNILRQHPFLFLATRLSRAVCVRNGLAAAFHRALPCHGTCEPRNPQSALTARHVFTQARSCWGRPHQASGTRGAGGALAVQDLTRPGPRF